MSFTEGKANRFVACRYDGSVFFVPDRVKRWPHIGNCCPPWHSSINFPLRKKTGCPNLPCIKFRMTTMTIIGRHNTANNTTSPRIQFGRDNTQHSVLVKIPAIFVCGHITGIVYSLAMPHNWSQCCSRSLLSFFFPGAHDVVVCLIFLFWEVDI